MRHHPGSLELGKGKDWMIRLMYLNNCKHCNNRKAKQTDRLAPKRDMGEDTGANVTVRGPITHRCIGGAGPKLSSKEIWRKRGKWIEPLHGRTRLTAKQADGNIEE